MASQLFAAALILVEHFERVEVEGYFFFFLINQLIPNTIQSAFKPRHAKAQGKTGTDHVFRGKRGQTTFSVYVLNVVCAPFTLQPS